MNIQEQLSRLAEPYGLIARPYCGSSKPLPGYTDWTLEAPRTKDGNSMRAYFPVRDGITADHLAAKVQAAIKEMIAGYIDELNLCIPQRQYQEV